MEQLRQLRQHLLTGVSYAIPFIACGGILIALSLAFAPIGEHGPDTVDRIGAILRRKRGPCVVYVQVKDPDGRKAQFRLGDDFRVNPAEVPVE